MKVVKFIVDLFEKHLSAIFLFVLFLSMFLQVILRYVFNMPSPELYEISTYSFAWTVLLGAAFARRYRDHIRFNIIYERLPRKVQLVIDIIFDSFLTVLLILAFPPVIRQALWYKMIRSEVLGIPWTYLVMCLPIFMGLVVGRNIVFLYRELRELIKGEPMKVEEKPWR